MPVAARYKLRRGIVRACAGIVEGVTAEPYVSHIEAASAEIGANYTSERERQKLIKAIKLNLTNRREYPFELLMRRYGLSVSHATFKREKQKFCWTLAQLCGFLET